jgi:hypothetical protein
MNEMFRDRIITTGLSSERSTDLNPFVVFMGNCKAKNVHTTEEVKENIRREVFSVSQEDGEPVNTNFLRWCQDQYGGSAERSHSLSTVAGV